MKAFISKILLLITFLLLLPLMGEVTGGMLYAQITGVIIDAETGDTLSKVSVSYRGHRIATISDAHGHYAIQRHNGWKLTFSAVGYKSQDVAVKENTHSVVNVRLKPETKKLEEVYVRSKKGKYNRKENPAIALMRRVIAAKKQTKLENKDFYQYRNYEKLTIGINDISRHALDSGFIGRKDYLRNQIEVNPVTGKNVLPLIYNEKISRRYYRKDPSSEKIYTEAERSSGINDFLETGELVTVLAKDIFTEVDLYDDDIRLLRQHFTSPIANSALSFYKYYIVDTVKVDQDSCIQVSFLPNNQQDFGFNGSIWVVKDSTLHVKKAELRIPGRSDINFVTTMAIDQSYDHLPSGDWVLKDNDMLVEMTFVGQADKFLVTRTSRRSDYSFSLIDDKVFRGKAKEKIDPYAQMRSNQYWAENRDTKLSSGEEGMEDFLNSLKKTKGFGIVIVVLKAGMENFVETTSHDKPSKVDIGPMTSIFSMNDIDGFRLRGSFLTTANLCPHLFFKGYVAHGFKSHKTYYSGTLTYTFNKKAYLPHEFPRNNLSFTSTYDICSASDKFMQLDKDNMFSSFKWSKVQMMQFYDRQILEYEREEEWGFATRLGLKRERDKATGQLFFRHLGETLPDGSNGVMNVAEAYLGFEFSPGQRYMNTKQQRFPQNHESPIFKLKHTIGINGFLGGQHSYHVTEASIYKRLWVRNCGFIDASLKGAVQWSKVPFPLLLAPAANLSLIRQKETFNLVNNMEFLNDRYLAFFSEWDLQGKILNRIPLIRRLKWREHFGINVLWGSLSDKNNPFVTGDARLMEFPEGSSIMNPHEPYMELRVGVHNIFKLFRLDYVRRLNYLGLPTAHKHSVRMGFGFSF